MLLVLKNLPKNDGENHALAIGNLNAVSVPEERKSVLSKFIEILMLRVN